MEQHPLIGCRATPPYLRVRPIKLIFPTGRTKRIAPTDQMVSENVWSMEYGPYCEECTEHVAICPDKLLPSLERESSMTSHWWHSVVLSLPLPQRYSILVQYRPATEGGEPDLLPLLAFSSNFLFLSSSPLLSLSLSYFAL